jgi:hypothetical protein
MTDLVEHRLNERRFGRAVRVDESGNSAHRAILEGSIRRRRVG